MPYREQPPLSIAALNAASPEDAVAMLAPVVERSPWLARRLAGARPFADAAQLAALLRRTIMALSRDERLLLLRAHPELAPATPETMTAASQGEQGRLGLAHPSPAIAGRLSALNRQYSERFGYPFIIALHAMQDLDAVLAQFEGRLRNDPVEEMVQALSNVVSVATARLARMTGGAAIGEAV
ncbi:2-oxo-4-hydroxy-4-carboxy-5-ureidoimidazoline decarboxylase [Pararhodobacter marinus]|uniref:2-oxo-4-hydroxy-4-carboxy-5-ureidoimidazoline decarboxylase n=1 Tax=Pararhodobacter marinus TaxID=2184063 RepID=A0A2U2CCS8_9RHOB|nr:2-oxo-4-hydroxy-4-carboxy-5-ureidoimidazoline decarboxylase [Pararhodobacter marinus]PWE29652.1 2-oxo-4-hydroxy-4-carboxy-5-ureidoimidazoline decarboxylase [Pararhodobacter marinus]